MANEIIDGQEVMEEMELTSEEEIQEAAEELEIPTNEKGEELLYPGGPTIEAIEQWKSQFKDVYFTEFEEEVFIWRCLSRKEYKEIMGIQGADNFYKEERICEKCVLWPKDYGFIQMKAGKAGIPTFLGEQVMDKSGFAARTAALKL